MEREMNTMRFLKRCEFWSFAIAALGLVWWLSEMWSAFQ
jgi:hypothetical protein